MAKNEVKRFVLSDETVKNSYGFFVATQGIKTDRFEKNPVMLSNHHNNTSAVLGRWLNLMVEGAQLTGEPQFDLDDDDAAKVAGKVERGFINGASVGLLFSQADLKVVGGEVWLMECELIEGTITPVPSNPNALQLYLHGKEDTPLTDADVKQLCLSLQSENPENLIPKKSMTKIKLNFRSWLGLGVKDVPDDGMEIAQIETHILNLSARVEAAEQKAVDLATENSNLKAAAKLSANAEGSAFLNAAVESGKINADEVAAYLSLYETNPALVKKSIDAIPEKANLSGKTAPGGTRTPNTTEVKSIDDFVKLDQKAQLAFKSERPDDYAKLFIN